MPVVNISELKEGMIVASPVVVQGNELLAAGKSVTSKVIHILKAWGVSGVDVIGETVSAENGFASDVDSDVLDRIRSAIDYRMDRFDPNDEYMVEIKRIMTKRAVQEMESDQEQS